MTTIKDVAAAAGVSASTVSAVLAGKAEQLGLRPETCRKVLETAAKLRYRKNTLAFQMKSGRCNTLALILPAAARGFVFRAAAAAGIEAEKHRYLLKIITCGGLSEFQERLEQLLGETPAAILHWGTAGKDEEYLIRAAGECSIPLIFLDYTSEDPRQYTIRSDDRGGIFQAVQHLHRLGHRRIAHVSAPLAEQFARERREAFLEAMRSLNLPVREENLFFRYDENDPSEMRTFLQQRLSVRCPPTAFCCSADYIASQLLSLLLGMGVKVPEQVSVTGYGNLSCGRVMVPQLTTIDQPLAELGSQGVKLAVDRIEKGVVPQRVLLPTKLLRRFTDRDISKGIGRENPAHR